MSWYVIDAVDRAFGRTKKCLLEPFDFWKWMKLVIIVMLIGVGSVGGGINHHPDNFTSSDFGMTGSFTEKFEGFADQMPGDLGLGLIIGIILFISLLVILFLYISSVMEFVFVDSLVSNNVRLWEYSRKYLRKGLGLFAFRILAGILLAIIIAAIALPSVMPLIDPLRGDLLDSVMSNFTLTMLLGIILVIAIIGGIINSFVNLSIPVSIYTKTGIFRAFSNVFGQFRRDWKQILVYWVGRFFIGLAVGIVVFIALLITIVAIGLSLFLVDTLLYVAFSAIIPDPSNIFVWIILVPIIIVQAILSIVLLALIAMPARVFMKYHMLTFLQQWYPNMDIPVFDMQQINSPLT